MHGKISKQMRAQQDRWSVWQAKQIELFQKAASQPEKGDPLHRRIDSKRPHVHLDKISSTLRRIRG
jgi:hypothetical protein